MEQASNEAALTAGRLEILYGEIAARMADLPVYNPALAVKAVGFRRYGSFMIGVMQTPWFMNILAIPDQPEVLGAIGTKRMIALPCGEIEFVVGALEGFGTVASASLFSPMDVFAEHDAALGAAEGAVRELFADEDQRDAEKLAVKTDRRALLTGWRKAVS